MPRANAPASTDVAPDAKAEESTPSRASKDSYAAISEAERIAIQSDLIWTGDYNGLINGEFSDRLVAAVKAFQKRNKSKDTGVLNPQERAMLAASAKPLQDEVGWRLVEDQVTGARVGLPGKLATETSRGQSGTRWTSAQGQLQIETFRIADTARSRVRTAQARTVRPAARLHRAAPDFFVISGTQGLKKFYVRAFGKDGEVRGMTILYDQAMEGTMDPVVVAMSSAFVALRRLVRRGHGALAAQGRIRHRPGGERAGHIVTDRQLLDGCQSSPFPASAMPSGWPTTRPASSRSCGSMARATWCRSACSAKRRAATP